ncbi:unnamed protein product [Discula destructiva]
MPGVVLKVVEVDEDGEFFYPATSPAPTSWSKATPKSDNAASPNAAAPWTASAHMVRGTPTSAQPSHPRQRHITQKAKKSFLDSGSADGSEDDRDDDDDDSRPVRHAPAYGVKKIFGASTLGHDDGKLVEELAIIVQPVPACDATRFFDTGSVPSDEDDQDGNQSHPDESSPARRLGKKGILTFSSGPPSVVDPTGKALAPKISSMMRGKSALAANTNTQAKKPIVGRKSTRMSTSKVQLSALDVEVDDIAVNQARQAGEEDVDISRNEKTAPARANLRNPTKRGTKARPKQQLPMKQSKSLVQNNQPPSNTSKLPAEKKKPAKPRQRAKPSAAEAPQESHTSGSDQDLEVDKSGSSASRPALRPAKNTRQAKASLHSVAKKDRIDQAEAMDSGASIIKTRSQNAEARHREQIDHRAGETSPLVANMAQQDDPAKSAQNAVQDDAESPRLSVTDEGIEKGKPHAMPSGAYEPKSNGESGKRPIAALQDAEQGSHEASPKSNNSNVSEAQQNLPVKVGRCENGELVVEGELDVRFDITSHMPPPRESHKHSHTSPTKQQALVETYPIDRSDLSNSSTQDRRPGSHASQQPSSAAARRPSTIAEEENEENEDQTAPMPSRPKHDGVTKAQTDAGGNDRQRSSDAHDNDGFQSGDDPSYPTDGDHTVDIVEKPENIDDMAVAYQAQLTVGTEHHSPLPAHQAEGFQCGKFSRKHALPEEGPGSDNVPVDMPVDLQHELPAAVRKQSTLGQQPHQHVALNNFPQARSRLVRQQALSHDSPTRRMKIQKSHQASVKLSVSQGQQPRKTKQPPRYQQPTAVEQLAPEHQRPKKEQQNIVGEPFSHQRPVWKQPSTMSQRPTSGRHAMSMVNTEQWKLEHLGLDWQDALNREAAVAKPPNLSFFSQPGTGVQSARTHLQSLSSKPLRPLKRARVDGPVSAEQPRGLESGVQFGSPPHGHSSDDVFAPKELNERVHVDPSVVGRLRGMRAEGHAAELGADKSMIGHKQTQLPRQGVIARELTGAALRASSSRGMSPDSCEEEGSEQAIEPELWQQSRMDRRAQQAVANINNVEQEEDDDPYEDLKGLMQRIVKCVMMALKSKEAIVHDVVKDYQTDSARIVHSIVGIHVEERTHLMEEHEQSRLRYIQGLAHARGKMLSIGAELAACDFEKIPIH